MSNDLIVEVNKNQKNTTVVEKQNHEFLTMIEAGTPMQEAAEKIGVPLQRLLRRKNLQEKVQIALDHYVPDAEVRKQFVLGRAMQMALEEDDPKVLLGALQLIAKDPALGLSGPGALVQVNNFGEGTKTLLEKISLEET